MSQLRVVAAVRPARPNGHGVSWELLLAREEQITKWVAGGDGDPPLSIVKIEELLARQGCVVPYRTLHRFAVERCGFRVKSTTMRINDGEPGVECQIHFAQMGFILDPVTGKKRRVHALIFTAVVSAVIAMALVAPGAEAFPERVGPGGRRRKRYRTPGTCGRRLSRVSWNLGWRSPA